MAYDYNSLNLYKANFDKIYTMEDPRAYYSVLGDLDYLITDVAEPVVRQLLSVKAEQDGLPPVVLDIGCSYGINAAVHRYPLSFDTLRRRYARREVMELSPADLLQLDASFFSGWPDRSVATFLGLDASRPAVNYAKRVGLIEDGVVADLEIEPLSTRSTRIVRRANVLLSTGCVGYLGEATFRKVLAASEQPPWVISFVLRMFPYDGVERILSDHGLVTERLAGATFVQRRFRNSAEFEKTLETLEKLGKDPQGLESEGLYHAELFVSRSVQEVEALPLSELVTVASGRYRAFGPRFVHIHTDGGVAIAMEP